MDLNIGKALEYSALGIAIVFAMIIVLMIVVKIMSVTVRNTVAQTAKKSSGIEEKKTSFETVPVKKMVLAPGSEGDVKLYNVSDRDAAMIMAIVADQMKVPLNELRFLSIREVNDDEV